MTIARDILRSPVERRGGMHGMVKERDPKGPWALNERFRGRVDELERGAATAFHGAAQGWLMAEVEKAPGGDALDLGCGTGALLRALGEAGRRGVGLDVTQTMCLRSGAFGAVLRGDAGRLPFGEDCFAVVTGMFCFQLLREPLRALREVRRVLKPGGLHVFLIQAPEWTEEIARRQAEKRGISEQEAAHLAKCACVGPATSRYSQAELLEFMYEAGLVDAHVESILEDSVLCVRGTA